jgi:adenylate cyclase
MAGMRFSFKLTRAHLAAAAGALLAVGSGLLLHEFKFGSGLAHASYDLLTVMRGDVRAEEAFIVYMDDAATRSLGQSDTAAWDRALHARLIERLTAAGARAIVFDVVFANPKPEKADADAALAKAMKESGKVILAADYVRADADANRVDPPFDLVRDAAAGMGSDEVDSDADLVVRQHTPRGDSPISSLSWAAAEFCGAAVTKQENLEGVPRWINYYGQALFIPSRSYHEALDPSLTPDSTFSNKVVFVGAHTMTKYAGERKDEYRNPYSFWLSQAMLRKQRALFCPGVEIQATAFLNLLRGDWLRRMTWSTETALLLGLGIVFGYGLVRLHPIAATAVALAGLALVIGSFYLLFLRKLIWFPWLLVVVQIVAALFWSILFNSVQLYVEKRLYEQTLRIYLPPALVKKFAKSRELLKPGAQKQLLTLFFSDIASFTTLSEGMDSDELATTMNLYFETAVAKCIHKSEGTVAKYIGDAIFAFWNAPDPQADHAARACEAALLLRAQADQKFNGRILPTRIGLHTGVANVGNFGSEQRVDYTALGESVNLASRLEGLNKHLGTHCVISGETKKALGDRLVTRSLGKFQLKGFEGLVEVHELIGFPDEAEPTRPWREAFAEALNNYEQRNLEFAQMGFQQVLELKPDDGPTKFYLERIEDLSRQQLPDNWVTHTILKEK